jgi:hypothetical protein
MKSASKFINETPGQTLKRFEKGIVINLIGYLLVFFLSPNANDLSKGCLYTTEPFNSSDQTWPNSNEFFKLSSGIQ